MSNPAGWYPQPDGQQRYWDGEQWTENFAPGAAPTVTPPAVARKNWFLRHKVITAIGAVWLLGVFAGIAGGGTKTNTTAPVAEPVAVSTTLGQAALDQAAHDQAAADRAAAHKAAEDNQDPLITTIADNLEGELLHREITSLSGEDGGTSVEITSASCSVETVNAVGAGTYLCDLTTTRSDASYYVRATVPENGDWTQSVWDDPGSYQD